MTEYPQGWGRPLCGPIPLSFCAAPISARRFQGRLTQEVPMIQAIFFDVDGTLVSFRTHTIPPSALEALHALRAKGIKLF